MRMKYKFIKMKFVNFQRFPIFMQKILLSYLLLPLKYCNKKNHKISLSPLGQKWLIKYKFSTFALLFKFSLKITLASTKLNIA